MEEQGQTVMARVHTRKENGDLGVILVDDRVFVAGTLLDAMQRDITRLRKALYACIGNAGMPDAGDGCRAVIATAKRALGEP